LKLNLNTGWVLDESRGNSTTWFADLRIIEVSTPIDVLRAPHPGGLENYFFGRNLKIASVSLDHQGTIVASGESNGTFYLALAKAFDPSWQLSCNGVSYPSFTLYDTITGFRAKCTGSFTIVAHLALDSLVVLGSEISVGVVFTMFLAALILWRKHRHSDLPL
jgi:hypothetical protein